MNAPQRGEVWWADLRAPRGSEPGHRRPVLVVQSNRFNDSEIHTILVAALTTNLRLADAPGNVRVKVSESGLPKPSVVNVSQLLTLSRQFFDSKAGVLPNDAMNRVAEGLRLVLGL